MIENIVVKSSPWLKSDIETIFEDEKVHFSNAADLPNLLTEVGVYKSNSEARRNNRIGAIPLGYTELKASKKRRLFIWNPTE